MRRIVLQCLFLLCCLSTFALSATRAQAATYTVTNLSDGTTDGTCSAAQTGDGCTLREAITASNKAGGGSDIVFAPSLSGTISLLKALPDIAADVNITGPGALELTVQRDANAADFAVFAITQDVTASFDGMTITNGVFDSTNGSRVAGGIDATAAVVTVSNCIITGNTGYYGGGIVNNGVEGTPGTLIVNNCAITDNTATDGGGAGIASIGSVTITNSTVSGNTTAADLGGGILSLNSDSTVDVSNTLFANNAAGLEGGGIDNFGSATVSNSTFSGNDAPFGGAIENDGGIMTLEECTVSNNNADAEGSGLDNYDAGAGATMTLGNCIIALNTFDDDVSGAGTFTYVSEGYNLIGGDTSGAFTKPGDQTGVTSDDLQLGPLQDNGGLTQTMALGEGSIAIDAGNADATDLPEFDQRGEGFPRVFGDAVDVGAFEAQAEPVPDQLKVTGKAYNAVALATLSGINVTAVRVGNVSASGQATTDGTGTYTLNLLPGTYRFIVKKATDTSFRIAPTFTNPATLTVENTTDTNYNFRAIGIGGRVINPSNIGVSGVTVNLYAGSSTTVTSTLTTDANGFFSFDGLAAGTWVVTPTAPTTLVYTPASRTLVVANSPLFTSFTAAVKINYSFSGRVTINNNGNAQGIQGATIKATRSGDTTPFTVKTTLEGRYTLKDLVAGNYTVTVADKGLTTTPVTVSLTAKAPTKTNVNLTVKRLLTGIVYNAVALKGFSGASVKAVRRSDGASFSVTTDSAGRYNLTLDVGTYDLSAVLPSKTSVRFNLTFPNPTTVAAEVPTSNGDRNFRAVGVTGRLITSKNVGVSGITVGLFASTDTMRKTPLFTGVTDADGFFSLDGTPDGDFIVAPIGPSTYNYAPLSQKVNVLAQPVFVSFTANKK